MDFDARIDHKFSNKASARIIGYYGHDYLKNRSKRISARPAIRWRLINRLQQPWVFR